MEETLKMMKTVLLGCEDCMTVEEILQEYRQTFKPNLLAYLFIKYYKMIYNISQKYEMLNKEDSVSFCLQELDTCMLNFSLDSKCKFTTYFLSCLKNRLRMEMKQLLTDKRYSNYVTEDIDSCLNLSTGDDDIEVYDYMTNCLTEKEVEHCKLLYMGYTNKELSSMLKVSVQYIYQLNKKIGKKLLNMV